MPTDRICIDCHDKEIVAKERERCAGIADQVANEMRNPPTGLDYAAVLVAKRIRGIPSSEQR